MKIIQSVLLLVAAVTGFSQTIKTTGNQAIRLPFSGKIFGEPHLSVHKKDMGKLLAAAVVIDPLYSDSMYTCILTSMDGGLTWKYRMLDYGSSNDPWTLITDTGTYLVSTLYKDGILVHRSDDFGKTWMKPFLIKGIRNKNNYDHETMIESSGKIYLCAERQRTLNEELIEEILLAESADDGKTFRRQKILKTGNMGMNTFTITALRNGNLLIPFSVYNYQFMDTIMRLPKMHFLYSLRHFNDQDLYPRFITFHEGKSFPVMHNVIRGDKERIFYIFTNEDRNKLLYTYSDDYGRHWTLDKELFKNQDSLSIYFPQMTSDKNGNILIAWFDGDKEMNQHVQISYSKDFGNSFSSPQTITDQSFNNQVAGNGWTKKNFAWAGGHYFGLISSASYKFQLLWADSRSGKLELYFSTIDIDH